MIFIFCQSPNPMYIHSRSSQNCSMSKFKVWLKIFFWAEIAGTICSILAGLVVSKLFQYQSLTAIGATIGENVGFYGAIFCFNIYRFPDKSKRQIIQELILQFGLTEIFDSFLIRPLCMYYCQVFISNLPVALFIGKVSADLFFYLFAYFFISKTE